MFFQSTESKIMQAKFTDDQDLVLEVDKQFSGILRLTTSSFKS